MSQQMHDQIVGEVAAKLKSTPALAAITSNRIFALGDPGAENATLPKIVVSKRKLHPAPQSQGTGVLQQANIRVEMTAADSPTLHAMCVSVQRAISAGPGISDKRPCVLIDTGREDDDSDDIVSRADDFGVFFPSNEEPKQAA
jgi:hypothetical protein